MEDYFEFISRELLLKLSQVKEFIKKHNPTIGIVTEEILRSFLKEHLPKFISVEQGFIRNNDGNTSKQCDIIIYDSSLYAPFYRINDIVIVPAESVIAVIEVKTSITSGIFHDTLDYFKEIKNICFRPTYLFIYNAETIESIASYFSSYKQKHGEYTFDHDTFQMLPDEITGINSSYHLKQDYVIGDNDTKGYSSYFFINEKGTEISALQNFYLSIYNKVENYLAETHLIKYQLTRQSYFMKKISSYTAFSLFVI